MLVWHAAWNYLKKNRYLALLVLCVLVYLASTLVWVHWNTRPPHWDMGRHLYTAQQYLNLMLDGQKIPLITAYYYYPPLSYWLVALSFQFLGSSVVSAILLNLVWALILAFSFLSIAKSLKSPRAGIFAFIFFITMPLVSSVTKDFQLDFPVTAMLAANLAFLIRSNNFKRLDMSLLYGISSGLGMLTKWMFFVYAILPLGVSVVILLCERDRAERLKNLFLGIFLGYIIASPWYVTNYFSIKMDFLANNSAAGVREGDPAVASVAGILWYPKYVLEMYLRLPWLTPVILATGILWKKLRTGRITNEMIIIATSGLGGLLAFILLRNKDIRYIMPTFIAVSMAAGLALDKLVKRKLVILVSCLIGVCIVSYFATSFISSGQRIPLLPIFPNLPLVAWAPTGYITGAPSSEEWCLEDAVRQAKINGNSAAYIGSESIWLNRWALQYYASRAGVALLSEGEAQVIMKRDEKIQDGAFWKCQAADGSIVSLVKSKN